MFWAEIKDGQVSRVTVSETNDFGAEWLSANVGGLWVECDERVSPNFTYDEALGFVPPKLYESWILNEDSLIWEAPIPYPTDGADYSWDEQAGNWVEVPEA